MNGIRAEEHKQEQEHHSQSATESDSPKCGHGSESRRYSSRAEQYYDSLSSALEKGVKWVLPGSWIAGILFVVGCAIVGVLSWSNLGDIRDLKNEIENKREDINQRVADVQRFSAEAISTSLEVRNQNLDFKEKYDAVLQDLDDIERKTAVIGSSGDDVIKDSNTVVERVKAILVEASSASDAITRERDAITELKKQWDEQLQRLREVNLTMAEYLFCSVKYSPIHSVDSAGRNLDLLQVESFLQKAAEELSSGNDSEDAKSILVSIKQRC